MTEPHRRTTALRRGPDTWRSLGLPASYFSTSGCAHRRAQHRIEERRGSAAIVSLGGHQVLAVPVPTYESIPALLLFRVATFWLPIPAGWIAYLLLQRRGVL